jgi:hypothetical protein
MADAPAAGGKGSLAFLTQKVGPLPLWTWLAAGGALWWYFQRKQAASASAVPNQQTDPAGNIGSIDPATGYVYGTPEDLAALAANNAGTGGGSAGQNATTGAQTYADNNTWGIAAVNYLVGKGINGTEANQAIQNYLTSQPLTSAQQGDVNLAIQWLGAPPSLPGPVSGTGGGTPPPPPPPPAGKPVSVAVPDGRGGALNVTFPSQAAEDKFYSLVGVTGGHYPNGLNNTQILTAVSAAGGQVIGTGYRYPGT